MKRILAISESVKKTAKRKPSKRDYLGMKPKTKRRREKHRYLAK